MTARPLLPPQPPAVPLPDWPLSPETARQFEALLQTLSADEAAWISGYLAALARQAVAAPVAAAAPAAAPAATPPLLILYGSETGHGEGLARRATELAQAAGLAVRCVDLEDFKVAELKAARQLLLITSTHGDGEPPTPAIDFCEFMAGRKAPQLCGLKFAVLGLGDSSYDNFCQTAKDLDRRLEALGGERVLPRLDGDVDYEAPAETWLGEALAAFARLRDASPAGTPVSPAAAAAPALAAQTALPATPRLAPPARPLPARVEATMVENLVLNGRGSAKETRHIELALPAGFSWEPGDSLNVFAENDPELVADLLAALDLQGTVTIDGAEHPIAEALSSRYEITTPTPGFVRAWAELTAADKLRRLTAPDPDPAAADRNPALKRYLAGRQIIDLVREFPLRDLAAADFVATLRPLMPRAYSLASSAAANPGEAHLAVGVVRYQARGRMRRGVASCFLAERRQIDDPVRVELVSNRNFRLPADPDAPLIMIGPGTGVAPFRAFLQEREATGAKGRNWLFFGDQHFRTDFLYQVEWQRWLKDGLLTRLDVAFSRDQAEKIYVQHRLREHRREIYGWLQDGAYLYVCGDAKEMAPDVHAALVDLLAGEGGTSRRRAAETLRDLQREKRYQRDVY